jgi:type IV secretory pathway VirB2 component (pilin)
MKKVFQRGLAFITKFFAVTAAWAQAASEEAVKTEFNGLAKFIVDIVTGPLAKIFALIFLLVAIWKIIYKDYGAAAGCVIALLVLVFLPQLLGVFGGG